MNRLKIDRALLVAVGVGCIGSKARERVVACESS